MSNINEYIVTLDEKTSNKLTELSEAAGIDNDLEYLESMVIKMINNENNHKKPLQIQNSLL